MKQALTFLLLCAGSAFAQIDFTDLLTLKLNVSHIVSGGNLQPIDWNAEKTTPQPRGGVQLTYSTLSSVWHAQLAQPRYAGPSWPPAFATAKPLPTPLERNVKTPGPAPDGNATIQYATPYYMQEAVQFPSPQKRVLSRVSNGRGNSTLNYRIKAKNPAEIPLDFFLQFNLPAMARNIHIAQALWGQGDGNGGTYVYFAQKTAGSRASFDVLIDGLPVYSTSSMYDFPENYTKPDLYFTGNPSWPQHNLSDGIFNDFGVQPAFWQSQAKLYLGKIAAGRELDIDVVFHADTRAVAPDCGSTTSGYYPVTVTKDCFDLSQSVSIPMLNQQADFRVYAKHIQ